MLEQGGIVWADVTPVVNGWYGDITRVWFAGEPSAQDAALVHDAEAILQDALAFVQPGMEARELFLHTKAPDRRGRLPALRPAREHRPRPRPRGGLRERLHRRVERDADVGRLGDRAAHRARARGAKFEDIVWLSTSGREIV